LAGPMLLMSLEDDPKDGPFPQGFAGQT
jgi:hypothetical protein